MPSVEIVIANKLAAATAINTAVGGNIFPNFRDDVVPSLAYDLDLSEADGTYEITGPVTYDLTISVVHSTMKGAMELGDLIIDAFDRAAEWSDSGYRVLSCFLRDDGRKKDSLELASKNLRLAVVYLAFDFTVDGPTATP